MNKFIEIAKQSAEEGIENGDGGPFGAVIVDENDNVISVAHNMVLKNNDSTAHAEMLAIRDACKQLKTYDLSGMKIYSTCKPCPMCLSAIMWSNIKEVYYACTEEDADSIGFRDKEFYDCINGKKNSELNLINIDRNDCKDLFEKYKSNGNIIY